MSKQEKLISELIEYLERRIAEDKESIETALESDYIEGLYGRMNGMGIAIEKIKELFDPVPTIKPGDKVRYHGWQYNLSNVATVDHLIERNGTYATIIHDEAPYIVPLEHLEVVKDE